MSNTSRLLDRKQLMELHPALAKGYRLDWLIRTMKVPVVKVGNRIYFDEEEIQKWIEQHAIPANKDL